jgi:acetamidase/formamidase
VFQLIVRKQETLAGTALAGLDYPLLETKDEWIVHGFTYANYLDQLGANAQADIFAKSSVDGAMRDAFRKMRRFLMTTRGLSEDEAISLLSVGVDFGISQVVDGNFGVHAIVRKDIFAGRDR